MPLGFDPVGSSALTEVEGLPPIVSEAALTGVEATGSVGSVTTRSRVRAFNALDFSAIGLLGTVEVQAHANVNVAGLQATGVLDVPGDVRHGGGITVFARGVSADSASGIANALVTNLHVTLTAAGVTAFGHIGDVSVGGAGVVSQFPVDVTGVEALAVVGDVEVTNTANAYVTGVVGVMPTQFDIRAMVSSFGTEALLARPSEWTPVKPA